MIFNKMVVSRTGRRIPLQPPTNFAAKAGNGQVTLTWTDPENETSGGTTYATWDYTRIVRKTGSSPADENDGELVVESSQKNQYQTTGFVDDGLVNDTQYFYGAFACSTDGVWSEGAFVNATPMAGTPIGELAEGTLITITENGAPVEFYVAGHDYQSDLNGNGRTLMVRKDCYDNRFWNDSNYNYWLGSTIYSWLNGSYKSLFSSAVQNLIGSTSYYYTNSANSFSLLTTTSSVFMISAYEADSDLGGASNDEGEILPIAEQLKIAYLNGSPCSQWTRSPYTGSTAQAIYISTNGSASGSACVFSQGSRPCFTLPSTALVDQDLNLIETSSAALEVAA